MKIEIIIYLQYYLDRLDQKYIEDLFILPVPCYTFHITNETNT